MQNTLYAIARPSVCVCLSHGWISQKTVDVMIMQFSPYSSLIPLVFAGKFHPEILTGSPRPEHGSYKGGVGKTNNFPAFCVSISKTVRHTTTKVAINDLQEVAYGFKLPSKSTTLDDLELDRRQPPLFSNT